MADRIEEITEFTLNLRQLDTLPSVAIKVIEAAGSDDANFQNITRLIKNDPALTAKLLKGANTPWLGMPWKMDTLEKATSFLGLDMVKNLGLSLVVTGLFVSEDDVSGDLLSQLWYHSLACAIGSENLARRNPHASSREAFIAGLLHDIGKLVLFHWNRNIYQKILTLAQHEIEEDWKIEKQILGIDHSDVAKSLMED
jgi:HD-like signal output (HDOD) protein